MSGRRNFARLKAQSNIARRGHEPLDGANLFPDAPKSKLSKAALRAQVKDLVKPSTMITKVIECRCGHRGRVRIPLARSAGPFKCVVCGVAS